MTALSEKVGQLLWVGFAAQEVPAGLRSRIAAGEVGATVLFRRNLGSLEQIAELVAALHGAAPARAPLLVAVDQEGGRVQRVRAPATEWPPMLRLGELYAREPEAAVDLAEKVGRALGEEIAALGFDADFAPVLDVHTNPQNPIIGDRAFATTPEAVIALAGAFTRGLDAAGILACGKHYPGHGDTVRDSHLELPRIEHPLERLRAIELAPFAAVPVPMIMTAHVVFDALDPGVPATLSSPALALLRGELGYGGVILSDDLEMKAIADHYGIAEAVERGLLAGCDAFLLCENQDLQLAAHDALLRAAARDSKVLERVEESAARVAALKAAHFARWRPKLDPRTVLGRLEHRDLADRMRAS